MFNIIKADLIKLKGSKSFNLIFSIGLFIVSIIFIFIFYEFFKYEENSLIFIKKSIISIYSTKKMFDYFIIISLFLVFILSLVVDSIFNVDKGKNIILLSKNVRIKYFLSKIFISILFSFLFLFLTVLISSLSIFVYNDNYNLSLFSLLFSQNLIVFIIFFISIIPLLLIFGLMSLLGIRPLFLSIIIVFFGFVGQLIGNINEIKTINFINNKTIIGNYLNIINPIITNENNYKEKTLDKKYFDNEIYKLEEELFILNILKDIDEQYLDKWEIAEKEWDDLLMSNDLNYEKKDYGARNKEIKVEENDKKLILNFYDYFIKDKEDLKEQKDNDFLLFAVNLYSKLDWTGGGGGEYLNYIENEYEKLKNSIVFNNYTNFWSMIINFVGFNKEFYIWFGHSFIAIIIGSVYIRRKQVYD